MKFVQALANMLFLIMYSKPVLQTLACLRRLEILMPHYTPFDGRQKQVDLDGRRNQRLAVRPPVTRGHRESEPLRQEERPRRQEAKLLWIYAISAVTPDGNSFAYAVRYALRANEDAAREAGWSYCYDEYREDEGYTMHHMVMEQVAVKYVAKCYESLLREG
jgi:hypothetical protein